jgi:hypothetical protein
VRFFNGAGTDPPAARPRWGDYSAAVTVGGNLWFASEWIAQRCTFTQYLAKTTCGGTRGALGKRSTRLSRLGTQPQRYFPAYAARRISRRAACIAATARGR